MIRLLSFADLISITNAIFGFFSIITIFLNEFHLAFSFILIAILADGLDGIVARKIRKSNIGDYLESMGDMASLGIAPSIFIFGIYYNSISYNSYYEIYLISSLIIYLFLGLIRLASFHTIKDKKYFVGLPASASTIFIIILGKLNINFVYMIFIIIILSVLMVSPINFPKMNVKLNLIAAILMLFSILNIDFLKTYPILLLFTAVLIYSIAGPIFLKVNK